MLLSKSDELSPYKGKEALSVLMSISVQSAISAWDRRMVVSTSVLPLSLRVKIYMLSLKFNRRACSRAVIASFQSLN
jgi:hypothetical protein